MLSRTSSFLVIITLIALLAGATSVRAQDAPSILRFDEPLIVPLPPGASQAYSFVVLAGDRFDLRLLALTPFTYSAALVDPLQNLAPLTVDSAGNATLTVDAVARSGRYVLIIQPGDTAGDIVIQLSGAPVLPDPLPINATTLAPVVDAPQRYRLDAQPDYLETLLTITRLVPEGAEGDTAIPPVVLPRVALIDAEAGAIVGVLGADALPGAAFRLAGSRTYFLALEPGEAPATVPVDVELRWEGAVPAPSAGAPSGAGGQSPGAVTATFTPFPSVTGTITTTVTATVTGTLTATLTPDPDATATPFPSPTMRGVLAPTATNTATSTPTIAPDAEAPLPTNTPTPAADQVAPETENTATFTPTRTVTPTMTFTPSYTPTTPPPVPTAPPDANFNSPLNIPLDSTASVTDFVSFPGGDTEDRVRWDISGMNPNTALSGGRARLILAVSCFGTGTQNVQFFTGGQTFSCGQTIVDREVTADSRTGQVTITAFAGTNTYVQWVLTGTATRVN